MRELSKQEVDMVAGGNLITWTCGGLQLVGAYSTGYYIGSGINDFNESQFDMSFGEALYYTVN